MPQRAPAPHQPARVHAEAVSDVDKTMVVSPEERQKALAQSTAQRPAVKPTTQQPKAAQAQPAVLAKPGAAPAAQESIFSKWLQKKREKL